MTIEIPRNRTHYSTRVDLRATRGFFLDIDAGVDAETRVAYWHFRSIDPETGLLVEDPTKGFLPPNDDTGRGEASVEYSIMPVEGVAHNTVITNQASIVFDYNAPILTGIWTNTIDALAPISQVQPLPLEAGRVIPVTWAGQDDGSGVATYDVYVSTNGVNYTPWLAGTSEQQGLFVGERGIAYSFYSIARDYVGNIEGQRAGVEVSTFVPMNAPMIAAVADLAGAPGDSIAITNTVDGIPSGHWAWSLGGGAPSGASVDAESGVFRWMPSCSQASRSFPVTVWVRDSGNPNLMDAMTFTVQVSECVVPSLGRQVLLAGNGGRVPIHLISTAALTNLSLTVEAPSSRVTDVTVESLVPEICSAKVDPAGDSKYRLNFATCAGAWLTGTKQIGWLRFNTVSNQSSAFVDLAFADMTGTQTNGLPVRNFAPQSGRLAVIGEEPMLEAMLKPDTGARLLLYGRLGWECDLQTRSTFSGGDVWGLHGQQTMTNLFHELPVDTSVTQTQYIRALRRH